MNPPRYGLKNMHHSLAAESVIEMAQRIWTSHTYGTNNHTKWGYSV